MKGIPVDPEALALLVMDGGSGRMEIVRLAVVVPTLLPAEMETTELPNEVGVPEMVPVVALKDKPEGRPVAPKLVGLLAARMR